MSDLPQKHSTIDAGGWPYAESLESKRKGIDAEVKKANSIVAPAIKALNRAKTNIWQQQGRIGDSRFRKLFEEVIRYAGTADIDMMWRRELGQLGDEMRREVKDESAGKKPYQKWA